MENILCSLSEQQTGTLGSLLVLGTRQSAIGLGSISADLLGEERRLISGTAAGNRAYYWLIFFRLSSNSPRSLCGTNWH